MRKTRKSSKKSARKITPDELNNVTGGNKELGTDPRMRENIKTIRDAMKNMIKDR